MCVYVCVYIYIYMYNQVEHISCIERLQGSLTGMMPSRRPASSSFAGSDMAGSDTAGSGTAIGKGQMRSEGMGSRHLLKVL